VTNSLLLLSGIFPPDVGGPAKFVDVYSKWISTRKWQVKVVSLTDGAKSKKNDQGINVSLISRRDNLPRRYLYTVFQIYRDSRRVKFILANGLFIELGIAAKIFGLKYVVKVPGDIVWERARNQSVTSKSVDDFQTEGLNWKYRIFRALFSSCLLGATDVIVPSQHLFELCERWGVPKNRIHLIHNSVFTDRFTHIEHQKDFDVLTVARLVKWKGIDEIIRSCGRNNLRLLVVGDGPEMQNLKVIAEEVNAAVTFTGEIAQENLVGYYSRSRSFVLNSNFEASSYSLLEAMACSLPVIASRNTGSSEVVRHGIDGLLIDETYSLQDALAHLFANPELFSVMGENGRQRVFTDFNSEKNFGNIAEILLHGAH
jgi:glycosyltransferase involved in cell wall biosynthesis